MKMMLGYGAGAIGLAIAGQLLTSQPSVAVQQAVSKPGVTDAGAMLDDQLASSIHNGLTVAEQVTGSGLGGLGGTALFAMIIPVLYRLVQLGTTYADREHKLSLDLRRKKAGLSEAE